MKASECCQTYSAMKILVKRLIADSMPKPLKIDDSFTQYSVNLWFLIGNLAAAGLAVLSSSVRSEWAANERSSSEGRSHLEPGDSRRRLETRERRRKLLFN